MNYLYSGMVYILQHSAATAVGWQLEQSFALFVSAHTGQGSKEATDFSYWLLTVIGTGYWDWVFGSTIFHRGYQVYTRIE